MNREPISPDDPELTAYALGELDPSEKREFEAKLEASPSARAELDEMDDIMALLSKGLKNEWTAELNEPNLEVLPVAPREEESKLVSFPFARAKKAVGAVAAAAAVVVLVAGSLVSLEEMPGSFVAQEGESTRGEILVEPLGSGPGVHVPRLVMNSEVEDMGNMSLSEAIENLETLAVPVDASYLDSATVVPPSSRGVPSSGGLIIPASFSGGNASRVDSYLPPVGPEEEPKTGLIEKRVNGSKDSLRVPIGDSTNVVVRGVVSLDNVARSLQNRSGVVLQGFQPVSMTGTPAHSSPRDLKLLNELQGIQSELADIVRELPASSSEKTKLLHLLERNRSAITGLRSQYSR